MKSNSYSSMLKHVIPPCRLNFCRFCRTMIMRKLGRRSARARPQKMRETSLRSRTTFLYWTGACVYRVLPFRCSRAAKRAPGANYTFDETSDQPRRHNSKHIPFLLLPIQCRHKHCLPFSDRLLCDASDSHASMRWQPGVCSGHCNPTKANNNVKINKIQRKKIVRSNMPSPMAMRNGRMGNDTR